eukprot:NODE_11_length_54881_cov_1.430718.p28 type:complete len:218 gc:universal NODE_11_length_54881_cov_1.430718:3944-4597(+)
MTLCDSTPNCHLSENCSFQFTGNLSAIKQTVETCDKCKIEYNNMLSCLIDSDMSMYSKCENSYNLMCLSLDEDNCLLSVLNKWNQYNTTEEVNSAFYNQDIPFDCSECTKQFTSIEKDYDPMKFNGKLESYALKICGTHFLDSVQVSGIDPYKWSLPIIISGFVGFFLIVILLIFLFNCCRYKDEQSEKGRRLIDTSDFDAKTRNVSLFPSLHRSAI